MARFALPFSSRRSQNALITGLKRRADMAGIYNALRSLALPVLHRRVLPLTVEPETCCLGVTPA